MDVQCERCKAEYEFDDALISGRGTTVKCTNCGHQFKIRKATDDAAPPDRWSVRTTDGRDLVFVSLRELQKAIHARQVERADTLTRGQGRPRALGAISELEPFFDEAAAEARGTGQAGSGSGPRPLPDGKKTQIGSSVKAQSRPPPPLGGRTAPSLRPIAAAAGSSPAPPPATAMPSMPMRPRIDTIRPPATANAAVPPPMPSTKPRPGSLGELTDDSTVGTRPVAPVSVAPVLSAGDLIPESQDTEIPTNRIERADRTPPMYAPPAPSAPNMLVSAHPIPLRQPVAAPPAAKTLVHGSRPPVPPPGRGTQSSSPSYDRLPPPTITVETPHTLPPPTVPVRVPTRGSYSSVDDEGEMPGRPRRIGGWLVALVLVVGAGVIGFAVAKPYLDARSGPKNAATALDPRAAQLLSDGERALSAGDLDGANDAFTRASALAEKDPHVLLDVAKLADARADVPWLRMLVLPPESADAADDRRATKAQLAELGARAKKAADDASGAAPEQPSAILTRIDALRITSDSVSARALVSKVIQGASQPETAYALAALDLAEPEPLWPMVIERLHLAAAGEGDAGRARAALVYALARSGDAAGAKSELDRLAGLTRPYPLVGALRAYVAKAHDTGKDAGAARATVEVSTLPHAAPRGGGGGGGEAAGGGGGGGGGGKVSYSGSNDPRFLLAQAETAKNTHDLDRARALYSSALAQNANDSEALAGLGDVDHSAHDLPGAATYYKRALGVNPVYLPALVGLGDVEWESGDRDEAQRTYRDIMERFPEGTYPARIRQRTSESSGTSATPAPATAAPTATAPASAAITPAPAPATTQTAAEPAGTSP